MKKSITKILKLKGLKVKSIYFKNYNKELYLQVKPYKNGCLCPYCGRRCKIHKERTVERIWRDVIVCGIKIFFVYSPKEIVCPTHKRVLEDIPWAEAYAHITYRLEYLIISYCRNMTQKMAAHLLKISTSSISRLINNLVERGRDGHNIRNLKSLGVDEIAYRKGRKYATIVYNLDKSKVVWVGEGKAKETLETFFKTKLSNYQKEKVAWASCDMSIGYINAIKENCPNVKLVLDRFHIVKALNEALDEVRKEEWRKVIKEERLALKGLRWILYKHSDNRSTKESRKVKAIKKSNNRIYRAWLLKDNFEHLWQYSSKPAAEKFLKKWITRVLRSRIDSMKKFALTARKYFEYITNFIERRLTNAVAEGLNRIIKLVKNRAGGFKSLDNLSNAIYLTVGDVDISAQIPCRFRTL